MSAHYLVTQRSVLSAKSAVSELVCQHRRSQGVQWVHLHPQGGEKIFRRNLQEKCVSAPPRTRSAPPARAGVNFWDSFCWAG